MDVEFEKGTLLKRFMYYDLSRVTNKFVQEGKLVERGFGGVYSLLAESNMEVELKRVLRGSKQGENEYISEVKSISHLRHRNWA